MPPPTPAAANYVHWLACEDKALAAAVSAGLSWEDVKAAVNDSTFGPPRSLNAVQSRYADAVKKGWLSPRPPRWPEQLDRRLMALVAQRTPWPEVAAQLRRSESSCCNRHHWLVATGRASRRPGRATLTKLEQVALALWQRTSNGCDESAIANGADATALLLELWRSDPQTWCLRGHPEHPDPRHLAAAVGKAAHGRRGSRLLEWRGERRHKSQRRVGLTLEGLRFAAAVEGRAAGAA